MLMPNTLGEEVKIEHEARIKTNIQLRSMMDNSNSEGLNTIQKTFINFESKYVQPIFGSNSKRNTYKHDDL